MSSHHKETITCPKCGKTHEFTAWDSVNVTLLPAEKLQILDNAFFTDRCPDCGHEMQIAYPLLYHDMEKKLMLYLMPGYQAATKEALSDMSKGLLRAGMDEREGYRLRVVREINDLREKIYIFDAGLDDRCVELMKLFHLIHFAKQNPQVELSAAYFCIDEGTPLFLLLPQAGDGSFQAPFAAPLYGMIEEKYADAIQADTPEGFVLADADWALALLRRQAGETD